MNDSKLTRIGLWK